jgi:hypothetical protein
MTGIIEVAKSGTKRLLNGSVTLDEKLSRTLHAEPKRTCTLEGSV